jgi:hypothetical protein
MNQRMFPSSESPHGPRPRLLVEDPSPALHVAEFRRFQDAGFDVALCGGPGTGVDGCPLVEGGACQLADTADIVLVGPGMAGCRAEVAAAHHRRRPDLPVVVQVPRTDPGQCPTGCIPDYYPGSVDGQIRSLWRALDRWPASHPTVRDIPLPSTAVDPTTARLIDLLGW